MRILLINNYSMERAFSLWEKGTSGSHHVWGKIELEKRGNIQMIILPHEKYPLVNKIGKLFGIGHLDQQIRVLFSLKKFDILYSPYSSANTRFLIFLKILGLFRKPIVVTIHQPFWMARKQNKWLMKLFKFFVLQYDASIFLSEPLMHKAIKTLDISKKEYENKFSLTQWGPDYKYLEKYCQKRGPFQEGEFFISAGHTDRDFETLIEAFRGLEHKLKIFCTPHSIPKTTEIPPNVEVNAKVTASFDLIPWYQKSIAILIPLKYPAFKEGCQGMTSLQDVVSFGKPVIMTKNPCLNLNVEEEGFGYFVDMYDVEGWKKHLKILAEDQEVWNRMSANSENVFKNKFNSEIFAEHLEKVFLDVAHKEKLFKKTKTLTSII